MIAIRTFLIALIVLAHCYGFAQSTYELVRDSKRDDKTYFYHSIDCSDKNNCTAVGHEHTQGIPKPYAIIIERTTDGGATWHFQKSGLDNLEAVNSPGYLRKVEAIDSLNIIIAGDSGRLLRTTDAGNTWIHQQMPGWIGDISFSDALTGMAVCAPGNILTTTDGGVTWLTVPNLQNEWLYRCKSYSALEQKAFVFGNGSIYSTTDGWTTWHKGDTIFDDEPGGLFWRSVSCANFTNSQSIIAGGAHHTQGNPDYFHNALIVLSQDGGKTWTEVFDSMTHIVGGIYSIAVNSQGKGVALGYGWGILTTVDFGLHWKADSLDLETPPLEFYSATLAGDETVFFLGRHSLARTKIFKAHLPQLLIARTQLENVIHSVRVYPNPASDQLNVSSLQQRYPVTYTLFDVLGRKVVDIYPDSQNNASVSIAGVPMGAYKLFVSVDNLQLPITTVCIVR